MDHELAADRVRRLAGRTVMAANRNRIKQISAGGGYNCSWRTGWKCG